MAGALKHKQRSHRSYGKNRDFSTFRHRAQVRAEFKNNKSLVEKIKEFFHRPQSK